MTREILCSRGVGCTKWLATSQDRKRKKLDDWQFNQREREKQRKGRKPAPKQLCVGSCGCQRWHTVAGGLTLKLVCKVHETIQCALASIACGSWMYLIAFRVAWFCTVFSTGHHGSHRNTSNKKSQVCSSKVVHHQKAPRALEQSSQSYLETKKNKKTHHQQQKIT